MPSIGALLEPQIPSLRRYARALTRDVTRADDLVQDCLCRAVDKMHLWQPGTDLRAWLFTILHSQYVNGVRRAVREIPIAMIDEAADLAANREPQLSALCIRDVQRALAKLSDEQRQVVLLITLERLSYDEAARILNVPVGTVRSRLSRGRAILRDLMEGGAQPRPSLPDQSRPARWPMHSRPLPTQLASPPP